MGKKDNDPFGIKVRDKIYQKHDDVMNDVCIELTEDQEKKPPSVEYSIYCCPHIKDLINRRNLI
jgi:hypothetical protein